MSRGAERWPGRPSRGRLSRSPPHSAPRRASPAAAPSTRLSREGALEGAAGGWGGAAACEGGEGVGRRAVRGAQPGHVSGGGGVGLSGRARSGERSPPPWGGCCCCPYPCPACCCRRCCCCRPRWDRGAGDGAVRGRRRGGGPSRPPVAAPARAGSCPGGGGALRSAGRRAGGRAGVRLGFGLCPDAARGKEGEAEGGRGVAPRRRRSPGADCQRDPRGLGLPRRSPPALRGSSEPRPAAAWGTTAGRQRRGCGGGTTLWYSCVAPFGVWGCPGCLPR